MSTRPPPAAVESDLFPVGEFHGFRTRRFQPKPPLVLLRADSSDDAVVACITPVDDDATTVVVPLVVRAPAANGPSPLARWP